MKTVSFFSTCLTDTVLPEVSKSTVLLLEKLGCRVIFNPRQTCCGQPLVNSGFQQRARKAMELQMDVLLEDQADYVVCPSGSCTLQVKEYPHFFKDQPELHEKARKLSNKIYELTDFIVNILGKKEIGASLKAKAAYHPSCHMTRLLGVKEPPLALLKQVTGLELVDFKGQDKCCGFGGTFSVKLGPLSGAMAIEKVENIMEAGADHLIGADAGCLMNLQGVIDRRGYPIKVMHIAQVLMNNG
ncbi:MAG: (Fe-S)-binding protein [Deltaproteobacteria bacterium]|nr:(Fe-S)-binding protein [Deltaproteobacteria bacterium]